MIICAKICGACLELLQNRSLTEVIHRVVQELAAFVNTAKEQSILPETNALIFTTEETLSHGKIYLMGLTTELLWQTFQNGTVTPVKSKK